MKFQKYHTKNVTTSHFDTSIRDLQYLAVIYRATYFSRVNQPENRIMMNELMENDMNESNQRPQNMRTLQVIFEQNLKIMEQSFIDPINDIQANKYPESISDLILDYDKMNLLMKETQQDQAKLHQRFSKEEVDSMQFEHDSNIHSQGI